MSNRRSPRGAEARREAVTRGDLEEVDTTRIEANASCAGCAELREFVR